jgi:UDP-glucose 6-dehydrogenase
MGEVGKALCTILSRTYPTVGIDKEQEYKSSVDVMHVCFPYSADFKKQVKGYIDKYRPKLTVIHSTVPVGTTDSFDGLVYHSPVKGKHPNLENSIKTFVKDIGGNNDDCRQCGGCTDCNNKKMWGVELERYFSNANIPASYGGKSAKDTEFAKIMCTTRYGWEIVFCKEMKRLCDKHGVNFDYAYTIFNQDYNNGYDSLGDKQFHRSILSPVDGRIGGHCVINNCKLDKNFITDTILDRNDLYDVL